MSASFGAGGSRLFQGKRLFLGGFRVERPVFSESPGRALLGSAFWSRFVVTFDFPARKVFLSKGQAYERPDRSSRSGLHVVRKAGAVVIESLDGGSPGDRAGFRAGDVLVELGGLRVSESSLFKLRAALCDGDPKACVVRRGSEERRLTIAAAP